MESDAVMVTYLFPPERASLVELLASLGAEQWQAPTVCPSWSVKDVALHLLGDDIGLLSRRRDGVAPADAPGEPAGWRELLRWRRGSPGSGRIRSRTGWMWHAPVLATFVHALPAAFTGVPAPAGTTVEVVVGGEGGGCWTLTRTPARWRLAAGSVAEPAARVLLDTETAWRLWTKGSGKDTALAAVSISGDRALGRRVLDAVAIIG